MALLPPATPTDHPKSVASRRLPSCILTAQLRIALLPDHMQRDLPQVRPPSMFEKIDALPRTKQQAPAHDWDGQADAGQRGAQMRRHIVRPFVVVGVTRRVLRRDARKKVLEVAAN